MNQHTKSPRRGPSPRFTTTEGHRLRAEHENGISVAALSKRHNCSYTAVVYAIVNAGGAIRHSKLSHDDCLKIADEYRSGVSARQLGIKYGVTYGAVIWRLKRMGVQVRTQAEVTRRFSVDEAAFDNVESRGDEVAAYMVGLLMTDGNVHINKKTGEASIGLKLKAQDKDHVAAFKDFLKAGQKLEYRHATPQHPYPSYRFRVSSQRLAAGLARYGVVPRKSKIAKLLLLTDNRHAWRGIVDGDGWVTWRRPADWGAHYQNRNPSPVVGLCSASKAFIWQFIRFVKTVAPGFEGRPYWLGSTWNASLSGPMARDVVTFLYSGCTVALARKWDVAKEIMGWTSAFERIAELTLEVLAAMHERLGTWKKVGEEIGRTENGAYLLWRQRLIQKGLPTCKSPTPV